MIFDVAVIGGGPAGLAAAAFFRRSGRTVALVAPVRGGDARTTALLGRSSATLRRAGAWGTIEAAAAPLRTIRIIDGTSRLFRAPEVVFRAAEVGLDAFGWNIANPALVDALAAAAEAAGVTRFASEADGVLADRDGARIALSDGGSVAARLVVAADGRGSSTRQRAGIAVREQRYPQAALVATFSHAREHGDVSTEFHTETGPFTLVPLPGRRSSVVCVEGPETARRLAGLPPDALGAEIERRSHFLLGTCVVEGPVAVFPLSRMTAERLTAERFALIAEAAHVVPPIGAQGLNLALRDIEVLAGAASDDDPGSPAGLDRYERRRRLDLGARSAAVDALNRSLLSAFAPVQLARGAGLFALSRSAPLRRLLVHGGLGVSPRR